MDPKTLSTLIDGAARGAYQRAYLRGRQRPSGADLRGRATQWSMRYAQSRSAAFKRLSAAIRWEWDGRYTLAQRTLPGSTRIYLGVIDTTDGGFSRICDIL